MGYRKQFLNQPGFSTAAALFAISLSSAIPKEILSFDGGALAGKLTAGANGLDATGFD